MKNENTNKIEDWTRRLNMSKKIKLFTIDETFPLGGQTVTSALECFRDGCRKKAIIGIAITDDTNPLYRENIFLCYLCAYELYHRLGDSDIATYRDYELSHELEKPK